MATAHARPWSHRDAASAPLGDLASIYRPRRFRDVLGQSHVTRPLEEMLAHGSVPPTLLLSGPPGTGKTSVARLVAASFACPQRVDGEPCGECPSCISVVTGRPPLSVWEINAATMGGIDHVRTIQERLEYAYQWHSVFIWDEAHRISREAFDALLKTLEEPPDATFILVTTEPSRIPATIISRSTPFRFEPVALDEIVRHLAAVADERGWSLGTDVVADIAARSKGSPRSALRLMELLASGGRLPLGHRVSDLAGDLLEAATSSDLAGALKALNELQGLAEPPDISNALADVILEAQAGPAETATNPSLEAFRRLPRALSTAISVEVARWSVPRGQEGAAAIRKLVLWISATCDSVDAGSSRPGTEPRPADTESVGKNGSLQRVCPNPVSSGLTRPLKNGKRVELKACDTSDCWVCTPELARDYLEVMRLAEPTAYAVVELPASRLTTSKNPSTRLRDIVGKARHQLGDVAWAWYAEDDGATATVKVHAAVRFGTAIEPRASELQDDVARAFGGGSTVSIVYIEDSRIDRAFLGRLADASLQDPQEAARRVAAHVGWNGNATIHTSKRFWLDEAGAPFEGRSPKDEAQKLGRRLRRDRGEYGVTTGATAD